MSRRPADRIASDNSPRIRIYGERVVIVAHDRKARTAAFQFEGHDDGSAPIELTALKDWESDLIEREIRHASTREQAA